MSQPSSKNFNFPFQPYKVQLDLMNALYQTLEEGIVGIFESPTGTGKTLSILCSTLTWMLDNPPEKLLKNHVFQIENRNTHKNKKNNHIEIETKKHILANTQNSPEWLLSFEQNNKEKELNEIIEKTKEYENKLTQRLKRIRLELNTTGVSVSTRLKNIYMSYNVFSTSSHPKCIFSQTKHSNKEKIPKSTENKVANDDEDLIVQWDENTIQENSNSESDEDIDIDNSEYKPKIIYCSRTHSQLSQLIQEIKKTSFVSKVHVITLASRRHYCINDDVLKLGNITRINDRCLDMQKSSKLKPSKECKKKLKEKTSKLEKCPFLSSFHSLENDFNESIFIHPQDIEDITNLGRAAHVCPYYGSRRGIKSADIIILPYTSLFHKSTRNSLGIKIDNHIVIIDEAHNLIEAINNVHTIIITQQEITILHYQLVEYFTRYESRLKECNKKYIKEIIRLVSIFKTFLEECTVKTKNDSLSNESNNSDHNDTDIKHSQIMTVSDFIYNDNNRLSEKIDIYNPFKLVTYLEESSLDKKLNGFMEKYKKSEESISSNLELKTKHISPLLKFKDFLLSLGNDDRNGRIVVQSTTTHSSLKYLMLNAAVHFQDFISKARSVILVGGTMKPFNFFIDQLFPLISSDSIRLFSCGHVIPQSNIIALSISTGPSDTKICFSHSQRDNLSQIDELGRAIIGICRVIPDGVVCFFPSYAYEQQVWRRWEISINSQTPIKSRIEEKKRIFREKKGSIESINTLLHNYSMSFQEKNTQGAILSCIVGGRLSEGINFTDHLARCVIVVGLPYPNITDPELIEKMKYIDSIKSNDGNAGQQYYQNICAKAINQSIGRSIRHKNDYSAIILLDSRYKENKDIKGKFPEWIKNRLIHSQNYGHCIKELSLFFKDRLKRKIS